MNKKARIIPIRPDLDKDLSHLGDEFMDAADDIPAMFKSTNKVQLSGRKGLKLTYQFKIKLRGTKKPPVWRRVLVPSQFTFSGLHAVIQEAFGWWDEHLYCFGDKPYSRSLTIAEISKDDWETPDYDARKLTLGEFFGDGNEVKKLCYVYDFGDDWIHDITLEKVLDQSSDHATCTAGKGACPEEDSGGIWGYEEMKQNGEIDATDFDVEEIREGVEELSPTGYEHW
ncbi:MAG: plasmid pRiA4b ORF-3 family protein [Prevotella sp.]|jgi:hypothetical protein